MRSRSGNTCHTYMCTKYGEPMLYGNGETDLIGKILSNLTKSVDHENEVMVR